MSLHLTEKFLANEHDELMMKEFESEVSMK